jgi:hypothetical protein
MENIKTKNNLKDFLPLISIITVIIIFTIYMLSTAANPDLMYGMRMFMSGFFIIFGAFKLVRWKGFVMAYKKYDLLAKKSTIYAYMYPLIEIGLGLAYFFAFNLLFTNIITLIIMIIGSYGVWLKIREKEEIPCACLGVVFKLPMTKVTLFEDLLMAIMAIVMIITLV